MQITFPQFHSRKFTLLTLFWLFAAACGVLALWEYALTPGAAAIAPSQWHVASRLVLSKGTPTLVLFVHPRCPCTRATLGELERIIADCRRPLSVQVLVYKPAEAAIDWVETDVWRRLEDIPGISIVVDPGGLEARRFCALTSGQTLLYDQTGRLLFSGGITGARGHEGNNRGAEAIVSLVNNPQSKQASAPVYGCPLCKAPPSTR